MTVDYVVPLKVKVIVVGAKDKTEARTFAVRQFLGTRKLKVLETDVAFEHEIVTGKQWASAIMRSFKFPPKNDVYQRVEWVKERCKD